MTETVWHHVTFFPDIKAFSKTEDEFDLLGIAQEIESKSAPTKDALPWLKLARFGDARSTHNSLRWNKNVLGVSGIEIDHDASTMTFEDAVARMRAARIASIVYTSPSYVRGEKEKWRVLAPFSRERAPKDHKEMVATVNGVLDDAAAPESFRLSQSFYYGRVEGHELRVEVIEGDFVDLRSDLHANRRYKKDAPKKATRAGPAPAAVPIPQGEIAAALNVIDPACSYDVWLRVAAALRHQLGEAGFDLFDDWSAGAGDATTKDGAAVYTIDGTRRQWDAVATMTEVGIGTMFHYANEADPGWRTRYEEALARGVMERLSNMTAGESEKPLVRPESDAPLNDQRDWLLATHAYCAVNDTVVELYEPSDDCQMRMIAFQRLFRAWHEEEEGKRGGVKRHYATAAWEVSPTRLNVRGVRMRPDRPFPLYVEGDAAYKNTYLRPQHEGPGDIAPWLAFMEHLLPHAVEREWFLDWLAHKYRYPGVPGVAIVMVAVNEAGPVYGAGRGMLRDIIARLLGPKYVKPIDFDIFTGKSGQAVYTDWGAYAVLVTVNEAKDTADSGRWAERRAVYERLKELVDPRAITRTFSPKGRPAFTAQAFASYLIFSNNRDALQIPVDDRRAVALANGARMSAEMAAGLQAWMDDPGNIAELARFLEGRDLTGFDMHEPLHTATKATMQDLARSELDDAFDAVRKTIGPRGLFTGEALQAAVLAELGDRSEPMLRSTKRMIRNAAQRVSDIARMPPSRGRLWILAWRGSDVSHLTDTASMQLSVEHTERRLADVHGGQGAIGWLPRT